MTIEVQVIGARRSARNIERISKGLQDRRKPHDNVGRMMLERTKQRVAAGKTPTGGRLRPLSPSRRLERGGFGRPLIDTGAMVNSPRFEFRKSRLITRTIIEPKSREQLLKARVHQYGRGVPIREWLGFGPEDDRPIQNEFEAHARKQITLGGGQP